MNPLFILFFIPYFPLSDGCLKVRSIQSTTPSTTTQVPGCGCISLALNSSTILDYVQPSNPFFPLLSTATLEAPSITLDECSGTMFCAGDYSLVIFDDTELGKIFGAYEANGFCDTSDRTWLIATRDAGLTKFNQLVGICFTTPTTPTTSTTSLPSSSSTSTPTTTSSTTTPTTTPTSTSPVTPSTTTLEPGCGCVSLALDSSTIRNYITPDHSFYPLLSTVTLEAPTLVLDECSGTMFCAGDYSLVIFDDTELGKIFGAYEANGFCETSDKTWMIATRDAGLTKFNQLVGICFTTENTSTSTTSTSKTTVASLTPSTAADLTSSEKTTPSTSTASSTTTSSTTSSTTRPTSTSSPAPSTTTLSSTISTSSLTSIKTTTTTSSTMCNCQYQILGSSTIRNFIDDSNPFYDMLTSENLQSPNGQGTGCFVEMSCEEGYSLLVFDKTGLGKVFAQSTSGQCDVTTQKWKIDTGSRVRLTTFHQINGVCVPNENVDSKTTMSPISTSQNSMTTSSQLNEHTNCTPTDQSTLLIAYSNDHEPEHISEVAWLYMGEAISMFKVFAHVRFDVQVEEEIYYHPDASSAKAAMQNRLPDPSLRFTTSSTGSDVLKVMKKFLTNTNYPICGSRTIILLKRNPNEKDDPELVALLRKYHSTILVVTTLTPSGGSSPETLYEISSRTNGFHARVPDIAIPSEMVYSVAMSFRSLFYAEDVHVSGNGTINLGPFTPPSEYIWLMYTFGDYTSVFTKLGLAFTFVNENDPSDILQSNTSFSGYYGTTHWQLFQRSTFKLTLQYEFSDNESKTVQIRAYSRAGLANWLPYQN